MQLASELTPSSATSSPPVTSADCPISIVRPDEDTVVAVSLLDVTMIGVESVCRDDGTTLICNGGGAVAVPRGLACKGGGA